MMRQIGGAEPDAHEHSVGGLAEKKKSQGDDVWA
jgi:hypothetical protein